MMLDVSVPMFDAGWVREGVVGLHPPSMYAVIAGVYVRVGWVVLTLTSTRTVPYMRVRLMFLRRGGSWVVPTYPNH